MARCYTDHRERPSSHWSAPARAPRAAASGQKIALVEQDYLRRFILKERDIADGDNIALIEQAPAFLHFLGDEQPPAPLGDDLDNAVNDFDGGLVINRVCQTCDVGRPFLCGGHRILR